MRGLIRRVIGAAAVPVALLVPAAGQAGGAPALVWSPSTNGTFDYGTLDAGQTASQTFTLTNSGGPASRALTIAPPSSAAFTKTADSCTATSLGPRKSCSVTVVYAPTAAGASDAATMSASSKKAANASLTLTGTGAAQLRTVTLVFNVTVPTTTDATGRSVYIYGSLDRLDPPGPPWDPGGVVLTRVDSTHWTITLHGKETTALEYKYTLGDFDHIEKDAACGELPNRQLTLEYGANGIQTVNDTVPNWRNVAPCGT